MLRYLSLALLTTSAVAAATPQQQPAEIQGRVINAATRQPVRGAIVSTGEGSPSTPIPAARRFLTDGEGRFVLRDIPPGAVAISASKHGYFQGLTGRRRPDGTGVPLVVSAGDKLTAVELLMWPMASISGTVTDERGAPMGGVSVSVSRRLEDPASSLRQMGPVVRSALTDDLGRYTVGGLDTGEYIAGVIVAHDGRPVGTPMPRSMSGDVSFVSSVGVDQRVQGFTAAPPHVIVAGRRLAYTGMFYGGVTDPATAAVIALEDGDERIGVDLRLEPQPTVRIAGTVTGSTGPLARVILQLSSGAVVASTVSGADGSFVFEHLPAATYVLRASRPSSYAVPQAIGLDAPGLLSPVVANRDIDNLIVPLGAGPTISGTVMAPPDVDIDRVRVRLQHVGSTTFTAAVPAANGTFAFAGVQPGRYVIRTEADPAGAKVESVEPRGRNVTDVPIDVGTADVTGFIVHVSQPAIVSGSVQRPDGKASLHAAVALFPIDASSWSAPVIPNPRQFQSRRVSGGGYFFENVPRGDYYLIAVDDALLRRWHERSLLQRLAATAVRITVAPGAEVHRDLTVDER